MNIETLLNAKNKLYTQLIALDIASSMKTKDGGKGSGNFGHSGRPGEVGDSAPEGSSISIEAVKDFMKNNNISNKELMSNYSLYPNELMDRVNKTLNGKNPVFSTEEKYNEAVEKLKDTSITDAERAKIQKAVNRYNLINKVIEANNLQNSENPKVEQPKSEEKKESNSPKEIKEKLKAVITKTSSFHTEAAKFKPAMKKYIKDFVNENKDVFMDTSAYNRNLYQNTIDIINKWCDNELPEKLDDSKNGKDNSRGTTGDYWANLYFPHGFSIAYTEKQGILQMMCYDIKESSDVGRVIGYMIGHSLFTQKEKSPFYKNSDKWMQILAKNSPYTKELNSNDYRELAGLVLGYFKDTQYNIGIRTKDGLKRYIVNNLSKKPDNLDKVLSDIDATNEKELIQDAEFAGILKNDITYGDVDNTYIYNDTKKLENYLNSVKYSSSKQDGIHKSFEKEAISKPDIKNKWMNTELKNYKKSINAEQADKNLKDMLQILDTFNFYSGGESRKKFGITKDDALKGISNMGNSRIKDSVNRPIASNFMKCSLSAMTINSGKYHKYKENNINGFQNELNVVVANAPIKNGYLVRYENEKENYREYEKLKPGDTFEFHSQHFTTSQFYEKDANHYFGGGMPVRLEIVGEKPFLSLEPYVWSQKSDNEYEGLVAGPVKVKSNEVVTDDKGRKIRRMTLEYDWNSSKSFMQTQLKSLALKNKLYGETANKKE